MRIALAQINPTVGDIASNTDRIRRDILLAREQGAQLVVFPELCVIGYPPKDLLLKPAYIDACEAAVEEIASICRGVAAIIGYPCPNQHNGGLGLHNAAALCFDGKVRSRHFKSLLPAYDVFDETRYFAPGPAVDLTMLPHPASRTGDAEVASRAVPGPGIKLGISICEDLWNDEHIFSRQLYHDNPADALARLGADLFINAAASPFVVNKQRFRHKLMAHVAKRYKLPLLYCNQVGGNDELIFDGNSCAFDAQGNLIAQARDFEEDLLIVEMPGLAGSLAGDAQRPAPTVAGDAARHPLNGQSLTSANRIETPTQGIASAYHALVLGLRDYCRKCGFKSVVVGLSGGIDSALTAALAVAALGAQNVRGIAMPSRYSSVGSQTDAQQLAQRLGIQFDTIPIQGPHEAFETLLEPYFSQMPRDATEENIQARIRGVILMAFSNKFRSLLVTTGNKSELAVGYCTLYGDMAGGLAVLSDVPKTMVYQLSRWINEHGLSSTPPLSESASEEAGIKNIIPESTLAKPPSAELRPDQTDQQSLPPYEVLDEIVERYVEREQSTDRIIEQTRFDPAMVRDIVRLIDRNEYKRKQAAPGLKITGRAFGFGRRMPIAAGSLPPSL